MDSKVRKLTILVAMLAVITVLGVANIAANLH